MSEELDSSVCACAIDAASILCTRLREKREELAPERIVILDNRVKALVAKIEEGLASTEELAAEEDTSVLYTAVIRTLASVTPFSRAKGVKDVEAMATALPGHMSRFCGAFLCMCEVIVEVYPYAHVAAACSEHIQVCFVGDGEGAVKAVNYLIREYTLLFKNIHFFARKCGGAPMQNLSIWPQIEKENSSSDANNNTKGARGSSSAEKIMSAAPLSLADYLADEGEEGEDEDKLLSSLASPSGVGLASSGDFDYDHAGYLPSMTTFSPPAPAGTVVPSPVVAAITATTAAIATTPGGGDGVGQQGRAGGSSSSGSLQDDSMSMSASDMLLSTGERDGLSASGDMNMMNNHGGLVNLVSNDYLQYCDDEDEDDSDPDQEYNPFLAKSTPRGIMGGKKSQSRLGSRLSQKKEKKARKGAGSKKRKEKKVKGGEDGAGSASKGGGSRLLVGALMDDDDDDDDDEEGLDDSTSRASSPDAPRPRGGGGGNSTINSNSKSGTPASAAGALEDDDDDDEDDTDADTSLLGEAVLSRSLGAELAEHKNSSSRMVSGEASGLMSDDDDDDDDDESATRATHRAESKSKDPHDHNRRGDSKNGSDAGAKQGRSAEEKSSRRSPSSAIGSGTRTDHPIDYVYPVSHPSPTSTAATSSSSNATATDTATTSITNINHASLHSPSKKEVTFAGQSDQVTFTPRTHLERQQVVRDDDDDKVTSDTAGGGGGSKAWVGVRSGPRRSPEAEEKKVDESKETRPVKVPSKPPKKPVRTVLSSTSGVGGISDAKSESQRSQQEQGQKNPGAATAAAVPSKPAKPVKPASKPAKPVKPVKKPVVTKALPVAEAAAVTEPVPVMEPVSESESGPEPAVVESMPETALVSEPEVLSDEEQQQEQDGQRETASSFASEEEAVEGGRSVLQRALARQSVVENMATALHGALLQPDPYSHGSCGGSGQNLSRVNDATALMQDPYAQALHDADLFLEQQGRDMGLLDLTATQRHDLMVHAAEERKRSAAHDRARAAKEEVARKEKDEKRARREREQQERRDREEKEREDEKKAAARRKSVALHTPTPSQQQQQESPQSQSSQSASSDDSSYQQQPRAPTEEDILAAERQQRVNAAREIVSAVVEANLTELKVGATFDPRNNPLPRLSTYAHKTGHILEGWLEKRSKRYPGVWHKRYYVLQESPVHFCVLKEYESALCTSWGMVPVKMLSYIPLVALESVQARSAVDSRASKKEFFIVVGDVSRFKDPQSEGAAYKDPLGATGTTNNDNDAHSLPSATSRQSSIFEGLSSTFGFGSSNNKAAQGAGEGLSREIRLKAPDEKARVCWVSLLQISRNVAVDTTIED